MTKEEQFRKEAEKWELIMAFRRYCIENNLCTGADCQQYERMKMFFGETDFAKDYSRFQCLASMVWICSNTAKTIGDLESDLADLYLNVLGNGQ